MTRSRGQKTVGPTLSMSAKSNLSGQPVTRIQIIRNGLLFFAFFAASAQAFELVTAQDVAQETTYQIQNPPVQRALTRAFATPNPDAPLIEVVQPQVLSGVRPPFPVELRFVARAGSQIDPGTLKVRYGMMGIDLTDRIRKGATVTPDGLKAEKVEIPTGDHRLTVRIADSGGHVGEKEIRIKVGD
jgi:hypothetical protein